MPSTESPPVDPIQATVKRLARPHRSGGTVIERAAILAEGRDSEAILRWITDHAGLPEEEVTSAKAPERGLYGSRFGGVAARGPSRYVLPPDALQ